MLVYDRLSDTLSKDGVEIKGKSEKKIFKHAAEYITQQVSRGKHLSDYPHESQTLPPFSAVMNFIAGDPDLKAAFSRAERDRVTHFRERLFQASEEFRANPNPTTKMAMEAAKAAYDASEKSVEDTLNVQIKFHSILPEGFWEQKTTWERKPRTKEDIEKRLGHSLDDY